MKTDIIPLPRKSFRGDSRLSANESAIQLTNRKVCHFMNSKTGMSDGVGSGMAWHGDRAGPAAFGMLTLHGLPDNGAGFGSTRAIVRIGRT